MANRTTAKSNIVTLNVPSVTNAILNQMLNGELADNVRFREDVATVQNSSVSSITLNFTSKDRIDLTRTGGSLLITCTGIGDGETKYLNITKTAGQTVSFVGITDITPVVAYVTSAINVTYKIIRKGSFYFAAAWLNTLKTATESIEGIAEIATQTEANALSSDTKIITPAKIPIATTTQKGIAEIATQTEANALSDTSRILTPGNVPEASTSQRGVIECATGSETQSGSSSSLAVTPSSLQSKASWITATLNAGFSGTVKYRKNNLGNVAIYGTFTATSSTGTLFTLPSGYRPTSQQIIILQYSTGNYAQAMLVNNTGVVSNLFNSQYSTSQPNLITGTIFLD